MLQKWWASLGLGVLAIGFPIAANATQVVDIESPANWRLQDYLGAGVDVFFTSATSPCVNGGLGFPSTTTQDEYNRFWSPVMTAKTTGGMVGLVYESTTCTISSFFAPP